MVLGVYNKINTSCHFTFNIKIIHPWQDNIQLHFASLNKPRFGSIISDIKQKAMEYLKRD